MRGNDYRGVPVLADARAIPDSPWFLITKIDQTEANAAFLSWTRTALFALSGLVMAVLCSTAYWWKRREVDFQRQEIEAQKARRFLEERFESLLRYANDIIVVTDCRQTILEVNERACAAYGYSRDEMLGRSMIEFRAPEVRDEVELRMRRLAGDAGTVFETLHQRKNGETFPVELSVRRMRVGDTILYQQIGRDITDRKRMENQLRDREERLKLALASGRFGVWDWEIPSDELLWDDRMFELYGIRRDSFSGSHKAWRGGLHPDDAAEALEAVRAAIRGEREYDTEFRVVHPGGTIRTLRAHGTVLRDQNGRAVRMIGINQDITEQKAAAEFLRESEERFRAAFRMSPDAVCITSLTDGCYVAVNDAFTEISGYEWHEIVGRSSLNPSIWADPADRDRIIALLREHRQVRNFEAKFRTKCGQIIDGLISARVLMIAGEPHILSVTRDVTEIKNAEMVLRREQERAQRYLDLVRTIIVQLQPDGTVGMINQAGCEILGFSEEEIVGQNWFDRFIPESIRDEMRFVFDSLMEGEIELAEYHENVIRRRYGEERLIAWHNVVVRNENGQIAGILSSGQDVTERKLAEDARRESENRYRSLFNSMLEGFAVQEMLFNEDGVPCDYRFLAINPAFERLTGLTADIIGRTVRDVIPDIEPLWIERCGNVVVGGQHLEFESQFAPLGRLFHVTAFRNAPGQFACILEDVTEQRKMEQNLRQSEVKHRTLLEGIPDLVMRLDRNCRTLFVSANAAELIGRSAEMMLGRTCHESGMPDEVCSMCENNVQRVFADGRSVETEFELTVGEERRVFDWRLLPERGEDGQVQAVLSISRDVTQRKQLEAERETMQAQLVQSQKLEAVGTLAGGIAHDFNNILGAIMGYTEMALMETVEGTSVNEELKAVLQASRRASSLVKQILSFSRRNRQERAPMALSVVVKEALHLLRATLPSTIQFRQTISTEGPVLADGVQMHQIIVNLCTNAGHAMREHGGTLEVSLDETELDAMFIAENAPLASPGRFVCLTVRDTGCGMPPEVRERVFEPFFTTKANGQGTGLGLSVVHGIVRSHGGTVTVTSEVGKGTTFQVYLPRHHNGAEAEEEERQTFRPGSERVLFVDDERTLVDLANRGLSKLGYQVAAFTDSRRALASFASDPDSVDLVISDVTMPDMPGDVLAREMAKVRPDVPIILLTGYTDRITPETAEEMGVTLVHKPLVISDLTRHIRSIFDRRSPKNRRPEAMVIDLRDVSSREGTNG